jgi:hypothetical protein
MPKHKNIRFNKTAPAQIYIDVAEHCSLLLWKHKTLRKEEILAKLGYHGANVQWDHIRWMLTQMYGYQLNILDEICHSPKLFTKHCTICQKEFQGVYNRVTCCDEHKRLYTLQKLKERRANEA